MIDHAGQVAGSEAVVDIDHTDPAGAGIEHGQQGGQPLKGGAVEMCIRDSGSIL